MGLDGLDQRHTVLPVAPLYAYPPYRRWYLLLRNTRPREILRQYRLHRIESLFLSSILICIFVILFSSILIHNVESNALDGNIVTGEDALWWALVTIATVGYGDLYPVTSYGRFLASLMIIFGVALFGVMTSFIATKFLRFGKHNSIKEIIELKEELTDLKSTLTRIEEHIAKTSSSENRSSSNDETYSLRNISTPGKSFIKISPAHDPFRLACLFNSP